jgi:predicted CXXCH cytochrome family protein
MLPDDLSMFDDPSRLMAPIATDEPGASTRDVVRILGVSPLWMPLFAAEDGRLQASSIAWDPQQHAWFDIFEGDTRLPGEWGHWTGRGMTWNSMCAQCHNTAVDRGWDAKTDTYDTTWKELGVGCEACHGPSARHAARPSIPTPSPPDRQAVQETCESCHIRWSPTTQPFTPGDALLDHGIPLIPGMDPGWHPDGGLLGENFEAVSFRQSAMYAAGIRCVDCHDPHSGETHRSGDALCRGCHVDGPTFDANHHRHAPESPGARCVACHMPQTTYMARHPRHDHALGIPDPGLARQLDIPSSCDRCHDLSDELVRTAETWWPADPDVRERTRALHGAWQGDLEACAPLTRQLAQTDHPTWKAILITALATCTDHTPLLPLASHEDGWVRAAVAGALPPTQANVPTLTALLDDPTAAVRLQAARSLRPVRPPTDPAMRELRDHLEQHGDQAASTAELAGWWASQRPDLALPLWRRAMKLDPRQPDLYYSLSVTLSMLGRHGEAIAALQEALHLSPDDAELHFSLALALATAQRHGEASAAFERTRGLAPDHGRAAYNHGLLLNQLGDTEQALDALASATQLLPGDAAPPYAAATILMRLGRQPEAQQAANEALRRDPNHPHARMILAREGMP